MQTTQSPSQANSTDLCPCCSGIPFNQCCGALLNGEQLASTAEALMRSRYTAYVLKQIDYLTESLHPDYRQDHDQLAAKRWAEQAEWLGLEVKEIIGGREQDQTGTVEFIANYRERGQIRHYHEIGHFCREQERWYYVEGQLPKNKTQRREQQKVGRNALCPCGSGKKYKKCCGS